MKESCLFNGSATSIKCDKIMKVEINFKMHKQIKDKKKQKTKYIIKFKYFVNQRIKILFVMHQNLQTYTFFRSNLLIYKKIEYSSYI